eukprot:gnl/MRDRNA2_/MRDRNA2_178455_c0_seq1.p1 gnl/MRDRNA2_/MRDRNA2_178455_c0~~gnl/MRDRNA2_/MRDRNA2_178455_c0_seq1.p1  ORF type:complete len:106 (-),score=18.99 gnl/MRDRNA2_/MRDRNA2_178455_c0_seq1:18-335(-)
MGFLGLSCGQTTCTCSIGLVMLFFNTLEKLERKKWEEHKQRESAMRLSPEVQHCVVLTGNGCKHEESMQYSGALSSVVKAVAKQADLSWKTDQARNTAFVLSSNL